MNKLLLTILVFCGLFVSSIEVFAVSTTAAVTATGSIIKCRDLDTNAKKYKRKDCPVCKGKGWYISGDGIKKVDCGYCEPEVGQAEKVIVHPPVILKQTCPNGTCPKPNTIIR